MVRPGEVFHAPRRAARMCVQCYRTHCTHIAVKMLPSQKDQRLFMRVDADFLRRIDDWRRQQPAIPSRSEAIRQLVEAGLGKGDDDPLLTAYKWSLEASLSDA